MKRLFSLGFLGILFWVTPHLVFAKAGVESDKLISVIDRLAGAESLDSIPRQLRQDDKKKKAEERVAQEKARAQEKAARQKENDKEKDKPTASPNDPDPKQPVVKEVPKSRPQVRPTAVTKQKIKRISPRVVKAVRGLRAL